MTVKFNNSIWVVDGKLIRELHLDDNEKLTMGDDDDATMYYDGTDLRIDPAEVGTGKISLFGTPDMDIYMNGSHPTMEATSPYGILTAKKLQTTGAAASTFFIDGDHTGSTNSTRTNYNMRSELDVSGTEGGNYVPHVHYGLYADVTDASTVGNGSDFPIVTVMGGSVTATQNGTKTSVGTIDVYGLNCLASGDLGTSGTTAHYGGKYIALGTADNNYGVFISASGATTNWALYNDYGNMYMGDDNRKTIWGTGSLLAKGDSAMYYDGTDLIIDAAEVGSGRVRLTPAIESIEANVGSGTINASGSYAIAYGYNGLASSGQSDILASGNGSMATGELTSASGSARIQATAGGARAGGYAGAYDSVSYIQATDTGAFAYGRVGSDGNDVYIRATSDGAVALGYALNDNTSGPPPPSVYITSSGFGSLSGGYGYASSFQATTSIIASGNGSMAWGYANNGTTQATGLASFAWGENVQATAANSYVIGKNTTNAVAHSFKIGTTNLGFFNTTPTTKPTVTGSRGGNAALASLLTGLANLGLLTDSST